MHFVIKVDCTYLTAGFFCAVRLAKSDEGPMILVRTLLERSCDRIPSVRAAAMRVLGNVAESIVKNDNLSGPWALALIPALRGSASGSTMTPSKKSRRFDQSLLEILRRRLNDINSTVKNAALRLMAAVPGVLGENTEVIPTELVRQCYLTYIQPSHSQTPTNPNTPGTSCRKTCDR